MFKRASLKALALIAAVVAVNHSNEPKPPTTSGGARRGTKRARKAA